MVWGWFEITSIGRPSSMPTPVPSCIVAAAAMQAVVRLGAIHAVVFAGFSAEALRQRINDSGAKVVVTMDSAFRGGKEEL